MEKKDKKDLVEHIEFKLLQRLTHIYDQKIDEQTEKIKELEERIRKLEESFLWAAHDLNM